MKDSNMKFHSIILSALTCAAVATLLNGCKSYHINRQITANAGDLKDINLQVTTPAQLKAHMRNGDVVIFSEAWSVNLDQGIVFGAAIRYNAQRKGVEVGDATIAIDSVALFESNSLPDQAERSRLAALYTLGALNTTVALICAASPKTCFGSCPTFYVNESDNLHYASAEGFSNAVLPSLEYADIDALNGVDFSGGLFTLTMKNEALETHAIRSVQLLAIPRTDQMRSYHNISNEFFRCSNYYPISSAIASEGDVTSALVHSDKQERISLSDANNMNSKEEIILSFRNVTSMDNLGLVLDFRQSLMTTYLIYSAFGYMGDEAGRILAEIERSGGAINYDNSAIKRTLGDIDVYLWDENNSRWEGQGSFTETGPIAINRQILPLQNLIAPSMTTDSVTIRLVLNRGLWRLDHVALTNIVDTAQPLCLRPTSVSVGGRNSTEALSRLNDTTRHLISLPGDVYKLDFTVPDTDHKYDLFVYSKGYYLEWHRSEWIKQKDLSKLNEMLLMPDRFLKSEAKLFKQYERAMEADFWNSRIDHRTVTAWGAYR
jgi:hypothetical protein